MTDRCPCVVAYVTAVQCCVSGLTYGYELLGAGVWRIKSKTLQIKNKENNLPYL